MIANYYQYNRLSPEIEFFINRMNEMKYRYYASELLGRLLHSPDFDMDDAVKRAIAIFQLTGIPVQEHIWGIYRSEPDGARRDWRLSELACGIIILSSSPANSNIDSVQRDLLSCLGL